MSFNYGYKPLIPMWGIIIGSIVGGVTFIGCVFVCCCIVRRNATKKADDANKVKKYAIDASSDDKISRFKYGRQTNPIMLPDV